VNVGDSIRHPKLGQGTVVSICTRSGRPGVEIDFGYMSEWVGFDELGVNGWGEAEEAVNVSLTEAGATAPTGRAKTLPKGVVAARRGVLALKLGQIIEEHVLELSTGTDAIQEELERIVSDVVSRRPRSVLFKGSYGAGKTHLLTMLSALAANQKMATASVILDGEGVALSDPMSLLEALLATLRYPGDAVPVGISRRAAALRRGARYRDVRNRLGFRLAHALFETPADAFDDPEIVEVLEAYLSLTLSASQARHRLRCFGYRSITLPSMKARTIDERSERFCELLRGWTEFCTLTGAKGLVLVLDEVDVEYGSTVWRSELRRRRSMLLKALDELGKKDVPLLLAFASAPAGHDVAPENDAVVDLVEKIGGIDLEVEVPLPTAAQMKELARRLQGLYERAYPERMARVDRPRLTRLLDAFADQHQHGLNAVPRQFVRGTLERLDVAPGLPGYQVAE